MSHLALSLLSAVLDPSDRDAILGDLEEESGMQSRSWLWRQALRSIAPALRARWRRGDLQESVLVPVLLVMLPFRALDLLWTYVLSNVPMRTAADRPIEFLCASLVCLAAGSFVSGRIARTPIVTVTAFAFTTLCLATAHGPVPVWYAILALVIATVASFPRRTV